MFQYKPSETVLTVFRGDLSAVKYSRNHTAVGRLFQLENCKTYAAVPHLYKGDEIILTQTQTMKPRIQFLHLFPDDFKPDPSTRLDPSGHGLKSGDS